MSSLVLEDATLIEERAQLSAWMLAGAKPSSRWVVGTEHEKFGWLPDEGRFPGFEGPRASAPCWSGWQAAGGRPPARGTTSSPSPAARPPSPSSRRASSS
ncbi:MAG: hypothetical protein R3F43_16020 [bacterium]